MKPKAVADMNGGYNSFDRDEDQVIDGIDNAELKKYLGKNSKYYVKNLRRKKTKSGLFKSILRRCFSEQPGSFTEKWIRLP